MTIAFTKVKLPFGWLGNMSPHPVIVNDIGWKTAEHAFQAHRFPVGHILRERIQLTSSPMQVKMIIKPFRNEMEIIPCSEEDLCLMREITWEKIKQHPDLKTQLLATGNEFIVEDVTKRPHGNGKFWGAVKNDKQWIGENWLGKIWMEHRTSLRQYNGDW